jgi:peptidoglycan pentaglycine glycine transferase (the first glycine)
VKLRELSVEEFNTFQNNHPLSNFYQTVNYAMLMAENGYDYDLIGYVDDDNNILAASVILFKSIGIKCFYGYAPRGFLINYNDQELLRSFTEELKKHYYEKNVIFIKTNPNIIVGEVNKEFDIDYNDNYYLKDILPSMGYKKLKDNLYFEAMLPRYNALIDLKKYNNNVINKNTRNKIRKGLRKGLTLEKCPKDQINKFYDFIKSKKNHNEFYYKDYYTVFEKNDDIDLFLVSIDYEKYLKNSEYMYNLELEKNSKLNDKLANNPTEKIINAKMTSDKNLLIYKNDILEASKGTTTSEKTYIAGALVIKHNKMVSIVYSGFDIEYKRFVPNYYLHYSLINYYNNNYDYIDFNGVVGDFKNKNAYEGLNNFKLGFNPDVYEYIGEYDLIIEPKSYDILLKNGILAKEFNKKDIKK